MKKSNSIPKYLKFSWILLVLTIVLSGCNNTTVPENGHIITLKPSKDIAENAMFYLQWIKKPYILNGYSDDVIVIDSINVKQNSVITINEIPQDNSFYRLSSIDGYSRAHTIFLILDKGGKTDISFNIDDLMDYTVEKGNAANKLINERISKNKSVLHTMSNLLSKKNTSLNPSIPASEKALYKEQYEYKKDSLADIFLKNIASDIEVSEQGTIVIVEYFFGYYGWGNKDTYAELKNKSTIREVKEYFDGKYRQKVKQQEVEDKITSMLNNEAPNFTLKQPNGSLLSLKNLRGQVVLIDFWASWCTPCIEKNNNMIVPLYEKYHKQGFEVLGTSIDKDVEDWKVSINKHKYPWRHVVDNEKDAKTHMSNVQNMYLFRGIPTTILIDKKGIIRGRNLEDEYLENEIIKLLKE